ncbi:hypothetical protein ACMSFF_26285 [Bacteroides faecis]|jgi:hypothetical protein
MNKLRFNTKSETYPTDNKQNFRWRSEGQIPQIIGSGEDAKNSIIYLVLKWAFIAAAVISTLVIINNWLFRDCENKVPDITSDLKVIWEIVTPIITLALGYAFGKSEK